MSDEKQPKIRFKGFEDPWEQRKLGELFKKNNQRNINNYFGVSKTISISHMVFNKKGNGAKKSSLSSYKVLKVGDIAFEGHTNKQFMFGRFVLNDIGDGIMSPRFSTIRPKYKINLLFWKQYIHYEPIIRYILVKSTKAGTMMNELVLMDFFKQSILVPSSKEQQGIGNLLDNVDNLIAANQSKLDQLKELKKLLMQKIFSQQWRFKGFTDPWEQRKFGEVIVLVGGGTPAKNNFKYWNGDISWLSSQEIKSKYIGSSTYYITKEGLDNSSARLISPGRLLIVVRSGILARRFPISISTEYVAINQDIKALIFDEKKIVLDFMFSQLQYLEPFILRSIVKSGTTVQSVNLPDFKKMIIEIPLISEQKTIGQLFKIFDDLIAANQRRLDQLKALKKYLMQNMFV